MQLTKNDILQILKNRQYLKKLKVYENEIISMVSFSETFEEAIFCIKNEIDYKPKCQYVGCSNDVPFRYYSNSKQFYPTGCCEDHTKKVNNLKKYGVENVSQLDTIQKKKESTTFKNYGVKNPKQNKIIAEKIKKTMQEKYNGFGKQGILRNKIESTCVDRFGTINPMQSEMHKQTLVKVLFDKIVNRLSDFVTPSFTFEDYQGSTAKQEWVCNKCSTIFEGKIDNGSIPRCPTCFPNQKMSYGEIDLFNSLDEYDKIQGDWTVLKNKELDIYIPSKKIAIEFNGIFWHSELQGKDRNYHLKKTERCLEIGIQLIHIFETEWYYQKEIVKSIIYAKLGKFEKRLFARHCQIKEITSKDKNVFLRENHLQGEDNSGVKVGLFYNDELVSVMTFGHSRYNKNYQYEMHRFCNKLGYQIIGGASKLFKYFLRMYDPQSIITYSDRRYSDGSFYEKIGFTKIGVSPPNFFIINKGKLESRKSWQKHLQKEKLSNFNPALTAWENMQVNGYDRIWDCGNYKFEWIKK